MGTPRRADVVVVGGGVTGSATAWSLARRGVDVVLLEQLGVDADAAVAALQEAAAAHGAVIGHHRRVTAVLPDGDGVRVRQAAGADVHARAAVVTAGARTPALLGPATVGPGGAVVVGGAGGADPVSALAVGRALADLATERAGVPLPARGAA